jgi:hypothetical protein
MVQQKDIDRFWDKVDKSGECWLWTAALVAQGYGGLKVDGKVVRAHRLSYELEYGPIPPGLDVLHSCDVTNCVRPSHLRTGTDADNMLDKVDRGRCRPQKGSERSQAKLTESDIPIILELVKTQSQTQIGLEYGVHQSVISRIVHRKAWKHVN